MMMSCQLGMRLKERDESNRRIMLLLSLYKDFHLSSTSQIKFMGPTWGPSGSCQTQMGPMLAPWTLLSGLSLSSHETNAHLLIKHTGIWLWYNFNSQPSYTFPNYQNIKNVTDTNPMLPTTYWKILCWSQHIICAADIEILCETTNIRFHIGTVKEHCIILQCYSYFHICHVSNFLNFYKSPTARGLIYIHRCHLTSKGNCIVEIRCSYDHIHFYFEAGPRGSSQYKDVLLPV